MTRENILKAIYDNPEDWSCAYSCPHTMEEQDPQKVCMECANRLLTEYEQKIRADAIEECIKLIGGNIKSIVGIYNKDTPLTDRASYRVAKNELIEELVKQLEQLKEKK